MFSLERLVILLFLKAEWIELPSWFSLRWLYFGEEIVEDIAGGAGLQHEDEERIVCYTLFIRMIS